VPPDTGAAQDLETRIFRRPYPHAFARINRQSTMAKPIPAFYCCYLLRSIPKPSASPYVGSTPHILRRWKQHNGLVGGGAFQTGRLAGSLRPWEVTCIVHGFPSQVAALQFEWAWQHAHLTRHITPADRLVNPRIDSKGRRAGKRATLASKLADLHTLLHTKSFVRWPLALRFFSADAYQAWRLWDDRSGANMSRRPISIELAIDETNKRKKNDNTSTVDSKIEVPPVLEAIDVGYSSVAAYLDKSTGLLDQKSKTCCSVCHSKLQTSQHLTVVCPHHGCNATSHLSCLAQHASKPDQGHARQLVPLDINCPECRRSTPWMTLVQELSLRTSGGQVVPKTLKKWRKAQSKASADSQPHREENEADDDEEAARQNDQDDSWIFREFGDQLYPSVPDDEFHDIDDMHNVLSNVDDLPTSAQIHVSEALQAPIVIPDSDWDNVEILD
jgi:structure-specific endonuclease subunit SLX1